MKFTFCYWSAVVLYFAATACDAEQTGKARIEQQRSERETERLVTQGRYLATIAVCAACHTPPAVNRLAPPPQDHEALAKDRRYRRDPDWFAYLDPASQGHLSGGVPFILRIPNLETMATEYGTVVTSNVTPDDNTGVGKWTEAQIITALRDGVRPDGTKLFLFAPHSFFRHLSDDDALALAVYLKHGVRSIDNEIPKSTLSREIVEQYWRVQHPARTPTDPPAETTAQHSPTGRSLERAQYLMTSLVGCMECHSYHVFGSGGSTLHRFAGGDPADAFQAVFRLGPDLPLRPNEKGFSTFPYPGYAVLYGGNLTRFGLGGDLHHVPLDRIVRAIRQGISTEADAYGREKPLSHTMLWQFYASMSDDDAYSIAEFLKTLAYEPHALPERLILFGENWEDAFEKVFGSKPSTQDRQVFGKP